MKAGAAGGVVRAAGAGGGFVLLGSALALAAWASCLLGSVETSAGQVLAVLAGALGLPDGLAPYPDEVRAAVLHIRLPRTFLAVLVGAALAVAGAGLQGLFRNPLADPGLIGVSPGAALGAVAAIVLGAPLLGEPLFAAVGAWLLPACAMAGAAGTAFLVYRLASSGGRAPVPTLLLTGIAVTALAGALTGALIFLSSPGELRAFAFWSMGSLGRADWTTVTVAALFIAPPLLLLPTYHRELNLFLLGDAEAFHLGVDGERVKRHLLLLTTAMVGASVAACGIIGFVGLVVPHLVRALWGPDHRCLIPRAALAGALVLLLADLVARTAAAPLELPIGILTALLGAPFFLFLITRGQRTGRWMA